jgi:hypothetical protein
MIGTINAIESELFGGPVFELRDLDPADGFQAFEAEHVLPASPRLAIAKVPAGAIGSIRHLEDHGFRFAEFQLDLCHVLRRRPRTRPWPYRWVEVTSEADLEEVLRMAETIFTFDRYTTDQDIPTGISGARYRAYVKRSFEVPDERVYAMRSVDGGRAVSFATFRLTAPDEARVLLGGVASDMQNCGLGVIYDEVGLGTYWDLGVRTLHTAISGVNLPILNLEVAYLGFKAACAWVVLHKHYGTPRS